MSSVFANEGVLFCDLCFEEYSSLCPEHKLSKAFREDEHLERCVELLVKDRIKSLPIWRQYKWQIWKPEYVAQTEEMK